MPAAVRRDLGNGLVPSLSLQATVASAGRAGELCQGLPVSGGLSILRPSSFFFPPRGLGVVELPSARANGLARPKVAGVESGGVTACPGVAPVRAGW